MEIEISDSQGNREFCSAGVPQALLQRVENGIKAGETPALQLTVQMW